MRQRAGIGARSWLRVAQAASLVMVVLLVAFLNWHPSFNVPLNPKAFEHDGGFGYIAKMPQFGWGAYRFAADANEHNSRSRLIVRENGKPLGPAHTAHDFIRSLGHGAFSHWNNGVTSFILFSTSDNSNPLTNGRSYTAGGQPTLTPQWRAVATGAILAILLINLYAAAGSTGFLATSSPQRRTATLSYRADIDGLRAVAVTLVVLFHLGFSWIPGGYLGVDVFFVISGYLITGIISQQVDNKAFSFLKFYARRIKRIFPALFVTVAATVAASGVLLLPGEYTTTAKSAIYAVSATSNFYFLFHTGYFDAAAEMMPLLHTWSLGVEEQFYLAWPALLVGMAWLFKRKEKPTAATLLLIGFLSYMGGTILAGTDPKASFYLPVTRAWEFVAGALISQSALARLQVKPVVAHMLTALGLILIVVAALLVAKDTPFPSWSMALPVIGAAIIVAPLPTQCWTRKLLASRPFVFVGQISYSLYLWHWPVITLYRHYNLDRPIELYAALWLGALMLVLSVLSWRYVELPFRRASAPPWLSIGSGFATAAVLAMLSFIVVANAGFPQRIPPSARLYESLDAMWQWKCPQHKDVPELGDARRVCVLGANWATAKTRGILIGDSHADHFAPLLDIAARPANIALLKPDVTCMPLVGTTSIKRDNPEDPKYNTFCADRFAPIENYIRAHDDIKLVVVASAWTTYADSLYRNPGDKRTPAYGIKLMGEGIKELATRLAHGSDRQFLIISNVPQRPPYDVGCLARSPWLLRPACPPPDMFVTPLNSPVIYLAKPLDDMMRKLPGKISNVTVSLPYEHMCDAKGCITALNHEFLYRDTSHLRRNMTPATKALLVKRLHLTEALEAAVARISPERAAKGH